MLYFKTISPVTGHISVSLSSKEYAAAGFALAEVFAACASCDSCDSSAVSVPCASLPVVIFSCAAESPSAFAPALAASASSLPSVFSGACKMSEYSCVTSSVRSATLSCPDSFKLTIFSLIFFSFRN